MLRNVLIATVISISLAWTADGAKHTGPACLVPRLATACSSFRWPGVRLETDKAPLWADFRGLVEMEDKLLGHLLDERFDGFKLPLDMREAEMAIEDLRTLVRVSELDEREMLADSLTEFLKCARNLRKSLVRFYSGVRDTLESILLGRAHASRVMESANPEPPNPRFRSFWGFPYDNEVAKNGAANQAFAGLMDSLSVKIERLSLGAEAPLVDIINLDKQLAKVQETATHKVSRKTSDEANVLSDLWAALSGKRITPKRIDENRRILQTFDSTKNCALTYVTSAQTALQTAEKQMLELRQRVAMMPEPLGEATSMAAHTKSLRDGIAVLREIKTQVAERRGRAVADKIEMMG